MNWQINDKLNLDVQGNYTNSDSIAKTRRCW